MVFTVDVATVSDIFLFILLILQRVSSADDAQVTLGFLYLYLRYRRVLTSRDFVSYYHDVSVLTYSSGNHGGQSVPVETHGNCRLYRASHSLFVCAMMVSATKYGHSHNSGFSVGRNSETHPSGMQDPNEYRSLWYSNNESIEYHRDDEET